MYTPIFRIIDIKTIKKTKNKQWKLKTNSFILNIDIQL